MKTRREFIKLGAKAVAVVAGIAAMPSLALAKPKGEIYSFVGAKNSALPVKSGYFEATGFGIQSGDTIEITSSSGGLHDGLYTYTFDTDNVGTITPIKEKESGANNLERNVLKKIAKIFVEKFNEEQLLQR